MDDLPPDTEAAVEHAALQKLQALLDDHKITIFTEAEANALRKMAKIFTGIEALGTVGSIIKSGLIWLAAFFTAWLVVRGQLQAWLSSIWPG